MIEIFFALFVSTVYSRHICRRVSLSGLYVYEDSNFGVFRFPYVYVNAHKWLEHQNSKHRVVLVVYARFARLSLGNCRGSRVRGRGSRVRSRGSQVEGRGPQVEGRGLHVEG